jgi:hypothetical protein
MPSSWAKNAYGEWRRCWSSRLLKRVHRFLRWYRSENAGLVLLCVPYLISTALLAFNLTNPDSLDLSDNRWREVAMFNSRRTLRRRKGVLIPDDLGTHDVFITSVGPA